MPGFLVVLFFITFFSTLLIHRTHEDKKGERPEVSYPEVDMAETQDIFSKKEEKKEKGKKKQRYYLNLVNDRYSNLINEHPSEEPVPSQKERIRESPKGSPAIEKILINFVTVEKTGSFPLAADKSTQMPEYSDGAGRFIHGFSQAAAQQDEIESQALSIDRIEEEIQTDSFSLDEIKVDKKEASTQTDDIPDERYPFSFRVPSSIPRILKTRVVSCEEQGSCSMRPNLPSHISSFIEPSFHLHHVPSTQSQEEDKRDSSVVVSPVVSSSSQNSQQPSQGQEDHFVVSELINKPSSASSSLKDNENSVLPAPSPLIQSLKRGKSDSSSYEEIPKAAPGISQMTFSVIQEEEELLIPAEQRSRKESNESSYDVID